MKKITTTALLLSTLIALPALAQGVPSSGLGGNAPKTRAEVRAELTAAVRAGYAPQSANRRDTAFVYGAALRARRAAHMVSSVPVPVENDTAD